MSVSQYSSQEYKNILEMSHHEKHLLVEGRTDVMIFDILFEEFLGVDWRDDHKLVIDCAETLISSDEFRGGNRERVEKMCAIYQEKNLVGFIDREFRNFQTENKLVDEIKKHYQNNNLIWSRGHSLENYYFEISILRSSFRDIGGDEFNQAYELFQNNFDSFIRTAGTLSLAGHALKQYDKFIGTIQYLRQK